MVFPNILFKDSNMLNTAERIVALSMKQEHITPVLHMLQWLLVEQQIHFKLLLTTFNVNGQVPNYIRNLLNPIEEYRPSRTLRYDNSILLSMLDFNMVNYGRLAFPYAAPRLWNNIPVEIQKIDTKSEITLLSKTYNRSLEPPHYLSLKIEAWYPVIV